MSGIENAWKTIFGDATDAIDEAGDAQQARIVQAIDLLDQRFGEMYDESDAARREMIDATRETIAKMKTEIQAGNLKVADQLKKGFEGQIGMLAGTYDLTYNNLEDAYKNIETDLMSSRDTARGDISGALSTARSDVTTGRDNALGQLRSSLTEGLNALSSGTDKASQAISSSLQRTRQTYAPYIAAGQKSITRMEQLANDPQAQLDYVQNNPFFNALSDQSRRELFANQAARGRLGTGGTLEELENRRLAQGEQFVNTAIERNNLIANQGLNAGNAQTQADTNLSNALAGILANEGINAALLNQNFGNVAAEVNTNAGNVLGGMELRAGEGLADIQMNSADALARIGAEFTNMLNNNTLNLGMRASDATGNYYGALANLLGGETQQLAGLTGQEGFGVAGANFDARNRRIGLESSRLNTAIPLLLGLGESEANEAIGEQAAQRTQFNDWMNLAALIMTGMNVGGFGNQQTQTPTAAGGGTVNLGSLGGPQPSYGFQLPTFSNPIPYGSSLYYNPTNSTVPFSSLNLG